MHIARSVVLAIACATALLVAAPARADLVITFSQVGPDVVATATGSLDLTGLTYDRTSLEGSYVIPNLPAVAVGPATNTSTDFYTGVISGPSSFGTGGVTFASSGTGDHISLSASEVGVSAGYVSGSSLSGSSTFAGQTFASMGLTPGTYTYTLPGNTIIVQVGPAAVPEPATTALFGLGVAGVFGVVRRRRSSRV